jgi:hypothetical protein
MKQKATFRRNPDGSFEALRLLEPHPEIPGKGKKRIRQTYWGNWNGYRGTKKVISFGTDNIAAKEWLDSGD